MSDLYPAEFYVALHQGTPGDLDYYRGQCPPGASVLELGCGDGRVLACLASKDRECTGIDIHAGLLDLAKTRLADAPNVSLVQQDMLNLELGRCFDRILLPFCGLYCVEQGEDLDRLFAGIKRHLAPGGSVILDSYSAQIFHGDEDEPDEDQEPHVHDPIFVRGVEFHVYEQSRWNRAAQQILVSYLHTAPDADAAAAAQLPNEVVAELTHHYWLRAQVEASAARAGLALSHAYGDFAQHPWDEGAPWNVFHFAHGS